MGPRPSLSTSACACAVPDARAVAADRQAAEAGAALLSALADPTRLAIVRLLARHERLCVCHITEAFPVAQPTISHHLRILREAGIVDVLRRGHWAYYGLRRDALKRTVADLLALL